MIRALALGSYVYQSAAALALIVCVSRLVPAEVYTTASLVLASAQLAGVFAFEWVQIAAGRYLSSATPETAPRLRVGLFIALALGAGALTLTALAMLAVLRLAPALLPPSLGLDGTLVLLGLGLALAQGASDLTLTMVRVDGRLGRAAWLMLLRASVLLAGTVAGAWLDGSARGVIAGSLGGQAASLVVVLATNLHLLRGAPWRLDRADLTRFRRYGMAAAGASMTHLAVPVLIRYLIVGHNAGSPAVAAGASLALDLLQRPFSVLVSAIHIVNYPEVVRAHDRGSQAQARAAMAHLLTFMLCTTVILLGGLVAFLPDAARLVVREDLQAEFLRVGAGAALFYFVHTHVQATLATVPHLQERAGRLIAVAAAQFVLVTAAVWLAFDLGATPRAGLLLAALGTALVAADAVRPTLDFGAYPNPRLTLSALAGGGAIGATALYPHADPLWLAARVLLAAGIVAWIARAGDFLQLGPGHRGSPSTVQEGGTPGREPLRPVTSRQGLRDQARPRCSKPRGSKRASRRRRAERSQA